MFCEDMYYFVDDDMGGHFKAVIGDQKANTMLGYLGFKKKLENLINKNKELKLKNQALENTKNTCPYIPTSGVTCNAKEKIKELEEELQMYKDIKRIAETEVTELAGFINYKGQLEKKDKIIDLMATEIYFKEPLKYTTVQQIKEDFEKKAEDN